MVGDLIIYLQEWQTWILKIYLIIVDKCTCPIWKSCRQSNFRQKANSSERIIKSTLSLVFMSSKLLLKSPAIMTSEWDCSNWGNMGGNSSIYVLWSVDVSLGSRWTFPKITFLESILLVISITWHSHEVEISGHFMLLQLKLSFK